MFTEDPREERVNPFYSIVPNGYEKGVRKSGWPTREVKPTVVDGKGPRRLKLPEAGDDVLPLSDRGDWSIVNRTPGLPC